MTGKKYEIGEKGTGRGRIKGGPCLNREAREGQHEAGRGGATKLPAGPREKGRRERKSEIKLVASNPG